MITDSQYNNLRLLYDQDGHTVDKRLWTGGRVSIRPKAIPPFCEVVTRRFMLWYPKRVQAVFEDPGVQEVVTVSALAKAKAELREPATKKPNNIYRIKI